MGPQVDVDLSRTLAHLLRHRPDAYGLELDPEGWVEIADVVEALRAKGRRSVVADDVERVVATVGDGRYETADGLVRARYGHSVTGPATRPAVKPPAVLYHGTQLDSLPVIMRDGLRPMRREYVHLSATTDMAVRVGSRRAGSLVVLEVDAAGAAAAGTIFRVGNERVWLAAAIAPEHLSVLEG